MNKRVKKKWLKAIRSGEYVQGTGQLVTPPETKTGDHEFCCLGVLTDLYLEEKNKGWDGAFSLRSKIAAFNAAALPCEVYKWAGLDDDNPRVPFKGQLTELAELNDGSEDIKAKSFKQIANLIERHL